MEKSNIDFAKEMYIAIYTERIRQGFNYESAFKEARFASNTFLKHFTDTIIEPKNIDLQIKFLVELIEWFAEDSEFLPNDETWNKFQELRKNLTIY